MRLAEEKCEPCRSGVSPLTRSEAEEQARQIPSWTFRENSIEREFHFGGFREAIEFVNRVAEIAEHEGHHPDIHIHYNKVKLELFTHKIGGLSRNDFVLAAKVDELL